MTVSSDILQVGLCNSSLAAELDYVMTASKFQSLGINAVKISALLLLYPNHSLNSVYHNFADLLFLWFQFFLV